MEGIPARKNINKNMEGIPKVPKNMEGIPIVHVLNFKKLIQNLKNIYLFNKEWCRYALRKI